MIRQIRLLTKIQICNIFDINKIRYSNDKKSKMKITGLLIAWILLILMLMGYISGIVYQLCQMGMAELIPSVIVVVTSMIVFFFTFIKAGSIIFNNKDFELQISLPVTKTAIIVSRFLTMYITNFILSFLIIIPGIIVYGIMEIPQISFYVYGIIGACFIPLLPLTISTILSSLITAISSKLKHKSIISSVITLILILFVLLFNNQFTSTGELQMMDMTKNIASTLNKQIENIYPMAIWLQKSMINGSLIYLLLFIVVSVIVFFAMVLILQKYFLSICSALNSHSSSNKFNMQELPTSSVKKTLWKKEIKLYFSSSIYVINTMVTYILMVGMSIFILVIGVNSIGEMVVIYPIMLGAMVVITPISTCAISMEGKNFWIIESLPITMNDIISSKIFADLSVVFPFYFVSEIISFIAIKPTGINILWLILIPALYIVFGAVCGLLINLRFPKFDWDNDVEVVKQSAATLLMVIVGLLSVMIPCVLLILFKDWNINVLFLLIMIVLSFAIILLFKNINKYELVKIRKS